MVYDKYQGEKPIGRNYPADGNPVPNTPLPLVGITTNAGTDSEVDQWGVAELKMSDFGFDADEMDKIADNARETMGELFLADPCELDHDDCVNILKKFYR